MIILNLKKYHVGRIAGEIHEASHSGKTLRIFVFRCHVGGTKVPDRDLRLLQRLKDDAELLPPAARMQMHDAGFSGKHPGDPGI